MIRLMLVRHGQTIDNVAQIMQGQTQGELTPEGIKQAEKIAEELKNVNIKAFFSSDLKRAIDTCTIIAQPHGGHVVTTPLLRERNWGSFTGRFIPDLQGVEWPDDIETIEMMQQRARKFLSLMSKQPDQATILAVGHGIINKVIQSVYHDIAMRDVPKMSNGEIRILNLQPIR